MNITTIIPVHKYDEEIDKLLREALDSLRIQEKIDTIPKVLIVYPSNLEKIELFGNGILKEADSKVDIEFLKNEGDTDFQSQINFAVNNIDTEWFTILEFDDVFSKRFYYHAQMHINKIGDDTAIFLPLLAEVNEKQQLVQMTNQPVWSKQFVGENGTMGYLNAPSLNKYSDFKISGAIINKESFLVAGGLKKNIKLAFTYEFLLRMLNNAYNIYSIPKILCKHFSMREGSLFHSYLSTMNLEERKFWFTTAKSESNFPTDREIDTSSLKKDSEVE